MSDTYYTRLALWNAQGQLRCGICDERVYDSPDGVRHVERVYPPHIPLVLR